MGSVWMFLRDQPLVVGALGGLVVGIIITKLSAGSKSKTKIRSGAKKMQLYHTPIFKSSRAAWMIKELGLQNHCDVIQHNPYMVTGEKLAVYKKEVHPNGLIPALRMPNGDVILESGAICFYLARAYNTMLPSTDMLHHYYSLGVYAVSTIDPMLMTLHRQLVKTPEGERDTELVARTEARLQESLSFINTHLAGNQYLCGDSFTAVDVIVGYAIMWASVHKGGVRLVNQPHLQEYLRKLKTRPHFSSSVGTLRDWIQAFSS